MKLLTILITFGTIFICTSQNIEKGCVHEDRFFVRNKLPGDYQYGPVSYEFHSTTTSLLHIYPATQDTFFIDLDGTNPVVIEWRYWDEAGAGPHSESTNTPSWYFNDNELDSSFYSKHFELHMGGCGMYSRAGSILSTYEPGNYDLRYIGGNRTGLPIIAVRAKKLAIIDIEPEQIINISLYPNPTNDIVTLHHGLVQEGKIQIYTLNGQLIESFLMNIDSDETTINLQPIKQGNYVIRTIINGNNTTSSKITKL